MQRFLVLTAIALGAGVGGAAAQSDAERAVLGPVESMFKAMRTRDTALLRSVFEPGARLVGIRTRADGSNVVQTISVDQWVGIVAKDPRPDWTERAFNPVVKIEGTLAQVWAEYDFHFGTTQSHCGIDAVQLLRLNDRWLIVSIADTYQKTGCPTRPQPGN